MINHTIILTAITILHLAFVTWTMENYTTGADIWSQTETTTNRKDDTSGSDSEQITTTNTPESFTYMANKELNISLENLVFRFNISNYVHNCTDINEYEDADTFQYISYDGDLLHELALTARELHDEFNELVKAAIRFICTGNKTTGHAVFSLSRIYVYKCKEFMVRLKGSTAATGEVGVFGDMADQYRTSIRHAESVTEFVEHLTEMIAEEANIDAVNQSIFQQYKEMYFFNQSSVWEIIVAQQEKLVSLLTNSFERAVNMSQQNAENAFTKVMTSSNISRLLDAQYWENLVEDETQALQELKTYLPGLRHDQFVRCTLKPVITAIVLVVGIAGNGLLLTIFMRHKETRTLANSMLINLTAVDCVSLVVNLLLEYLRVITPWQFGLLGCKLFFYFRYVFIGVSVYSVVMISVQRFAAVKQVPSLVWCHQGKKTKYVLLATVWGLGFILSVPHAIVANLDRTLCYELSFRNFGPVSIVDLIAFCAVPVIIAAVFSGLTAYRIRRSIRRIPGEATGQGHMKHNRMVSANVLVALVVLFVASYTPDFLLKFLTTQVGITVPAWKFNLINLITYYLRFVNCCLNPIVLFVMSARYRGYIKRYCGQSKTQPASKSESSTETTL